MTEQAMNPVIIGNATLYRGDSLTVLSSLPDCSVQTCVTSPPYWGLRDYGTATWEGGDAACDHKMPSRFDYAINSGLGPTGAQDQASNVGSGSVQQFKSDCRKCGANRIDAQLGLESTPAEYVEKMVAVFREVRRVLRDDGTLWLNLGSSYASNPASGGPGQQGGGEHQRTPKGDYVRPPGFKPKDMVPIPWMVAMALQSDGWYLRQDIIWAKPNPMPESVKSRCTKSHEYIFLMAKSEKYYFDAEAIAEQSMGRELFGNSRSKGDCEQRQDNDRQDMTPTETRNKRSVWTVTPKPFKGAHFATFPPDLIEPCILAGSKAGDTVLDPFNGSGTTGLVALQHGRHYVGIELNPDYLALTVPRLENAQRQERMFE